MMCSAQPFLVNSPPRYRMHEQGAALIVVLLFLVLIMLAGVMAVRQSSTDLKTATADQVNTLLLQGADGANIRLENMVNGSDTGRDSPYDKVISDNGIFGHFFNNLATNDELIYCYNPRQPQYMTNNTRIIRGTGVLSGYATGSCDATNSSSYISGRNTVLTQVSIRLLPKPTSSTGTTTTSAFDAAIEGRDTNNVSSDKNANLQKNYNFEVRSTAALPSYNDPGDCFTRASASSAVGGSTLSSCLTNKNVPKKQLYSKLDLEYSSGSIQCIPYGTGTGAYLDTRCVVAAPSSGGTT